MITNIFTRERQRDMTYRRGNGHVIIKAQLEEMQPQGKEGWIHQEMKETRNKLPKEGMLFQWHLDVGSELWISYSDIQNCEGMHFCYCKPSSLWQLVIAATHTKTNTDFDKKVEHYCNKYLLTWK